jgi:RHS repeat-associated protein
MLDSKEQAIGYVKFSSRYFTNTALGYDDYYPFGKIMPGRSSSTSTPEDDYKFTGHQRDAEIGLDYMLARNYDPLIGRFMQVDPLAGDYPTISPYGYVLNNPLGLVDPTGMAATDPPFGNGWLKSMVKQLEGYYMGVNTFSDRDYVNTMQSGIGNDLGNTAYLAATEGVGVAKVAGDVVNVGATASAIAGVIAAPFTKGASIVAISAPALTVATLAEGVSTAAAATEMAFFGADPADFNNRAISFGLNMTVGGLVNKTANSLVQTNSIGRFYKPMNGQFVSNKFGYSITTARVASPIIIDKAKNK